MCKTWNEAGLFATRGASKPQSGTDRETEVVNSRIHSFFNHCERQGGIGFGSGKNIEDLAALIVYFKLITRGDTVKGDRSKHWFSGQ